MKALILLTILATALPLFAHENAILGATMKAISKDVALTDDIVKKPNAADVTDLQILNAIVRARTATASLVLIQERREGEMFPPVLEDQPTEVVEKQLTTYAKHLGDAAGKLGQIDVELNKQLKLNASQRSFKATGEMLGELWSTVQAAHAVFKPQHP